MSEFLTLAEILAIHRDQIERYGGSDGVRDPGQLEAALFRPQSGYYTDSVEEAAALWESLGQNHPFIDGNKRTAFAVTYTFLAINGVRITAEAAATHAFIAALYQTNSFAFSELLAWLRINTSPR
ncbi:MAG: type II toxin-antitoxin system death-on-curing family toxin [Pseudomonadota bacterium]|nr:type II toxin-antitoxin system death-on-curing family toxin [Pseudomonadota bacterium]